MSNDRTDIAAVLRALPGVTAVEPENDEGAGAPSLRLWLSPSADGLVVAAAASRMMHDHLGSVVDVRRVHTLEAPASTTGTGPAARPEPPPHPVPAPRGARPRIARIELLTTGSEVAATVQLSCRGQTASGACRGAAITTGIPRTLAQATLRALEGFLREGVRLELEHVELRDAGDDQLVLVQLSLFSQHGEERLTGAAVVRQDESAAAVRATLDAANRRIEALVAG